MTINDFIAMTQRIVAEDGSDEYLPTLVLPDEVLVLEGIPEDVDVEHAARSWVAKTVGESEDYFLAFKTTATQFRVVARQNGLVEERSAPFFPV